MTLRETSCAVAASATRTYDAAPDVIRSGGQGDQDA